MDIESTLLGVATPLCRVVSMQTTSLPVLMGLPECGCHGLLAGCGDHRSWGRFLDVRLMRNACCMIFGGGVVYRYTGLATGFLDFLESVLAFVCRNINRS